MSNHHIPPARGTSVPPEIFQVKEKSGGAQAKKIFQVKLQGEILYAVEKRAKELGLSPGVYMRDVVEKDLVRNGVLPNWWFTRNRKVRP